MARFSSRSVVSLASVFTVIALVGACDSDESNPGGPDASAGTSGRGGSGGSGGRGGSGGSGGAPDVNVCNMAVDVVCDGPEDCPTGQRCCGRWEQQYLEFGCFASCAALEDGGVSEAGPGGMGPLWFDLCHPGDTCEREGSMCLRSQYLPDSLSRCYTEGSEPDATLGKGAKQINCGDDVCTSTEKCCLRGTFEPYCTPSSAECECDPMPPDAGGDASPDSGDASPDAGDASPDAQDSGGDAPTG